ncbi:MAG: 2-hydroxyacyl-CoA dehydratase, partial [Dehalococcoidales bacterium]|nr:2-hydroxyacyl-CoA dehydratase [Dehalococcoidales bacterium]
NLPEVYDYTREFRRSFVERRLKEAGIPEMSFVRDYQLTNTGQLKTKVGAFLEVMKEKVAI